MLAIRSVPFGLRDARLLIGAHGIAKGGLWCAFDIEGGAKEAFCKAERLRIDGTQFPLFLSLSLSLDLSESTVLLSLLSLSHIL